MAPCERLPDSSYAHFVQGCEEHISVCPGWLRGQHGQHGRVIMNLTRRSLFQTDACMHLVILACLVRVADLWFSPRMGPAGAP